MSCLDCREIPSRHVIINPSPSPFWIVLPNYVPVGWILEPLPTPILSYCWTRLNPEHSGLVFHIKTAETLTKQTLLCNILYYKAPCISFANAAMFTRCVHTWPTMMVGPWTGPVLMHFCLRMVEITRLCKNNQRWVIDWLSGRILCGDSRDRVKNTTVHSKSQWNQNQHV